MKKKTAMKRILCMGLSVIMVATVLTGCGDGTKKGGGSKKSTLVTEQAEQYADITDVREVTEGVELTIAIPASAKVLDYNNNQQTLMIEEALGVDITYVTLPSADYASKLNVMVMGGEELPDIIFNPKGWEGWIEEGVLYDLKPFYDNDIFAANIKAGSERSGVDLEAYLTRPDGGVYAVPTFKEEIYTSVQQKLWVYQPWLDQLGAKVPVTTEEYYQLCKQVVAADLNNNGKKDEIGIAGSGLTQWFDCMMSAFIYAHDTSWRVMEDGKVSFAFTTDEWKEGLKYIRKFFDEGLIPRETLSQGEDQYRALYNASTPVLFSFADWNYTGTDLNRRREYTVLPALKGPDGAQYSCDLPIVPTAGAVITTDCDNPLAAFLVCDYMCNEEMSITQRYGERGVDWDYIDELTQGSANEFVSTAEGYDVVFAPYDMISFWESNEAQSKCYREAGPMILDMTLTAGAGIWSGSSDEITRANAELELVTAAAAVACYEYKPDEIYDYAPLTSDETDDVADVKSAITSYVTEMTSAFLSGEKDIDAEWDQYLKEIENIGSKEYLETLQTAYERVH